MTHSNSCRPFVAAVSLLLLSGFSACGGQSGPRASASGGHDPALVREQRQRIAAFDSVVRSINTDSSYRAWHTMLTAPDLRAAQLAMLCDQHRLNRLYGRAGAKALERMRDTLWKHVDRKLVLRLDQRSGGRWPGISRNTCGTVDLPPTPTWLDYWDIPALPALPPAPDSTGRP